MYKVIGIAYENGEKREIYYGEFEEYAEAFDYKEHLEQSDNWKDNKLPVKPYMFYIEDVQ